MWRVKPRSMRSRAGWRNTATRVENAKVRERLFFLKPPYFHSLFRVLFVLIWITFLLLRVLRASDGPGGQQNWSGATTDRERKHRHRSCLQTWTYSFRSICGSSPVKYMFSPAVEIVSRNQWYVHQASQRLHRKLQCQDDHVSKHGCVTYFLIIKMQIYYLK